MTFRNTEGCLFCGEDPGVRESPLELAKLPFLGEPSSWSPFQSPGVRGCGQRCPDKVLSAPFSWGSLRLALTQIL